MKTLCINALLYAATCLDDRVKTSLAKLDQSPVAGIGAYDLYDPAVPAPGSFTASPTAANPWTLTHVRMCLQTRLHTHFRTRPIGTKGYNYYRLFKSETDEQLRIRVVSRYKDRRVHFLKYCEMRG